MPTGYTAMLDDNPEMTTARWIKEGLSRAFGICIVLRDDDMNLSEEQIEKRLKDSIESSTKYYVEGLEKTQQSMKIMRYNPKLYYSREYEKYVKRTEKQNKQSIEKAAKTTARHSAVMMELNLVIRETDDETTKSIAKYGLEQLDLVKREREPYVSKIMTQPEFILDRQHSLERDLGYYKQKLDEAIMRETERFESYKKLVSEVNRILEE